jgi:hypothetical protein
MRQRDIMRVFEVIYVSKIEVFVVNVKFKKKLKLIKIKFFLNFKNKKNALKSTIKLKIIFYLIIFSLPQTINNSEPSTVRRLINKHFAFN